MAYLECPTRNDLPSYSYSIQLDQVTFTLTFIFNMRNNRWYLNLGDNQNNVIISQVPLVVNTPLFDSFISFPIPSGSLIAFDTSGQALDPDRFALGDRVRLIYKELGT